MGGEDRPGWAVLERDGRIADVGPAGELRHAHPNSQHVVLAGLALLPGAVNAHSHSFQSLLRGYADDLPFEEWREPLYRFMPRLNEDAVHTAGLHAFGEMLLRGSTTVCDFFYLHHGTNDRALALARAARDVGIRLVLARSMLDAPTAPEAFREDPASAATRVRELASTVQGDDLVSVIPAPHSPHGASAEMIVAGARAAAELETPWHIHVAEARYEGTMTRERYGLGPLAWIRSIGALDARIRLVHGVWLEDEEIDALAAAGGGPIHCPGSNLFLGDGVAALPRFLGTGVMVSLGCDSGSANSRLSIFGEMRLAATLQKGLARSSTAITAAQAFAMGTVNGAHAAGQPVGDIVVGRYADLIAVDLGDLSLVPRHELVNNVVYSMETTAIRHVYVHGEQVVRDGRLVRVTEATIAQRVGALTAGWSRSKTAPRALA